MGVPLRTRHGSEELRDGGWGYARQGAHQTTEYRVAHPSWRVSSATSAQLECDVAQLYGTQFVECLNRPPSSAFLAGGSGVTVYKGERLQV